MSGPLLHGSRVLYTPLFAAGALLLAAVAIMPGQTLVSDAIRRAAAGVQAGTMPLPLPLPSLPRIDPAPSTPERMAELSRRWAAGERLGSGDLRDLLAGSTRTADAAMLAAVAEKLDQAGQPVSSSRIAYEILASGRPQVAQAFLGRRPDGLAPSLWRLRVELARAAGDASAARRMLLAAASKPGSAPAKDLIEAAYALGSSDILLSAAENGVLPRLDRRVSRDLAQQAAALGRYELIARIDRAGSPDWRRDDPWLAMSLARRAGDNALALQYAAMLPAGGAAARDAIVLASGDREAIRAVLLQHARSRPAEAPKLAQQLLEAGFRNDALALLRGALGGDTPDTPLASRLLFLMGPRPDPASLAWLREKAAGNPAWRKVYLERERPGAALGFLEANAGDQGTEMQLQRLALASAARDRVAATRALTALLDGRALSRDQIAAATAHVPAGVPQRLALKLTKARLESGLVSAADRLDLAWDAWNRGDIEEASDQLTAGLQLAPTNRSALTLMGNVQLKLKGNDAARPWFERALAQTPGATPERASLLELLDRKKEALAVAEKLRTQAPGDKKLAVLHARLLIATGHPGQARKELRR